MAYRLWFPVGMLGKGIVGTCLLSIVILISCNNHPGGYNNKKYDRALIHANHLYENNEYDKAITYIDSATAHTKGISVVQKFNYLNLKCVYNFKQKQNTALALQYADEMLALFNTPELKEQYISYYSRANFYKGDIVFERHKFNEAYEYYYKGKLIGKKALDACLLSEYSYRMGMITYKQEHYKLSAVNFKNAWAESVKCDIDFVSFYRRQELLNNTALSYSKINENDSAKVYYDRALAYINTNAMRFPALANMIAVAKAVIYGNQANLAIRNHQYDKAAALLKQSIAINLLKGNDNQDAQFSEMKLADIYFTRHRDDSLRNLLADVKTQLEATHNLDAAIDWNHLMADLYIRDHQYEKAINYLQKYNTLKDSLTAATRALKDADVEQETGRLEKEYELTTLKKDNEAQNLYLRAGTVFAVMLVIIGFLVFLNWRKSKTSVSELGKLNTQIGQQKNNLQGALYRLEKSIKDKDRILRTVAHDLRNPIGGIASLTNMMAEESMPDDHKQMISLIHETSVNSLVLINEIMEAAANDSAELKKEPVEINGLVTNCVELLRFKAAEKEQLINMELNDTPIELNISREKVWRVISNLISNAIKFSPEGKEINVNVRNEHLTVEINVKDNGIGIPENLKNKVFNTFTDAKRSGTAGEKSFGLGLSISKQIIEGHQGNIWFESAANLGTTFHVSLPKQV